MILRNLSYNKFMVGGRKFSQKIAKWLDEWKLAGYGLLLATKNKRFWLVAGTVFVIFGTILSLLSGGVAAIRLLQVSTVAQKTKVLTDAFLALIGFNRAFWDFLIVFGTALLQAVLSGLIVATWKWKKIQNQFDEKRAEENVKGLETAGIAAGLAILGSGCPTCGTTLLAPMIAVATSSGGLALAGVVSGVLTSFAILIAILMLKKIGFENYILVTSVQFQKRKEKNDRKNN